MTEGTTRTGRSWRLLHVLWIVPVLLLLVQNLLLWTPAARWAMNQVPVVRMSYRFAYSFIPGHLTLFDARVVVSDRAVQMQIDARRADLVIDLFALRNQVLHVTSARGDGVRIRFRPVLRPEQTHAAWVAMCPPIEGVPMPPVWRHPELPKPPTEKLLKFHFENMDVSLEETWLGPLRLEGVGHVQGGFLLHPRTRVAVFPAQLRFARNTRLSLGQTLFSSDMALALKGTIAQTEFGPPAASAGAAASAEPGSPASPPFMASVNVHVELDGPFKSLAALEPLLPRMQQLRVTSGAGQLSLTAGMTHGQLDPGLSFKLDSGRVRLTAPLIDPPLTVAGPFAIRLRAPDGKHVAARMDWSNVLLSYVEEKSKSKPSSAPTTAPRLKHLQVEGKFTLGGQVLGPSVLDARFEGGRVLVEELELPQLSFFSSLLENTPLQIRRGHGLINAEVDIPANLSATGQVRAQLHDVVLLAEDAQVDFSAGLEGQLRVHPQTGQLSIQPLTFIAQPLHVRLNDHRIAWPFRLTTGHTSIDLETGNKVSDVAVHGPSLEPFLDAIIKSGFLRKAGKLIMAQGDTEARLRFTQSKATTRLDVLSFKSGRVVVDGVLMTNQQHLLGAFLILGTVVRIGIVVPPGKKRVHPTASRAWLEKELARQGIPKVKHERIKPGRRGEAKRATR